MLYTLEEMISAMDEYHDEIIFDYKGRRYIISESIRKGPNGEKWGCFGPDDEQFYANDANGMLDAVLLDGKPLRDMLDKIE